MAVALPARPEAAPLAVDGLRADLSSIAEFALGDSPGGIADLDLLDWRPIRVPGSWQKAGVPEHGYAWYRFRFSLSPAARTRPLAFTCSQIRDVDEAFLDGVRVGGTGAFPPAYDKGTLQARLYELPATITSAAGPHVLAIRVYNAGPRGGGLTAAPYLDSLSGAFWRRTMFEAPLALVAAAIFSLGLFALFVFLRDRRQREFLLFFLLTAGVAAYFVSWLSLWSRLGVSLSFIFRANVALAFALSMLFALFFHYFFVLTLPKWMRFVLALQFAGMLMAFALPRVDDLYRVLPLCYATVIASGIRVVAVLVRKVRRRTPYAVTVLVGFGFIFVATLRDMAQDFGLIPSGVRTQYVGGAFLVFSVLFLSVVADRMARLRVAAVTDPLTGLPNRTGLFDRIALELARSSPGPEPRVRGRRADSRGSPATCQRRVRPERGDVRPAWGLLPEDYNSRMKLTLAAVLALAAVAGVPATAQQVPTPVEQHVVVPSLPDQPNKEGVARPSGSMPTDSEGYVRTNRGPVDPSAGKPTPGADATSKGAQAAPASGLAVVPAGPAPPPGPSGPTEVKAAYLSVRGTVKAYAKGVSITIVEKGGVERTVKLATKASVYDGLAAGDKVVLRIPLEKSSDGKTADRVSRQRPPKAPPKSKFSAAQSPVR